MTWMAEQGTYLTGKESIDSLDLIALACERRYGADRLRLLVPEELRTKFDRQRKLVDDALVKGELEDVLRECKRMILAWKTLDKVALENPANLLPPTVWEIALEDGSVAQIVRESNQAGMQAAEMVQQGRKVAVYTLEEIGRLLSKFPSLYQVKDYFPGATVVAVRQTIGDPWLGREP